jgi:beta propeller repeat protein
MMRVSDLGGKPVWRIIRALAAFCFLILSSPAAAFEIIQITNNSTYDAHPAVSGSNVVWWGCDGGTPGTYCTGGDYEIYLYNGSTTTQITNNSLDDEYPAISGSNVVWEHRDGNDGEIYLWDGVTTTQITNNDTWDAGPAISGSNVVWSGCCPSFFCAYFSGSEIVDSKLHVAVTTVCTAREV